MDVADARGREVVRQVGPDIAGGVLTYAWLALLFVTTRIQRSASRRKRQRLLQEQSTNIAALQRKPLRVLLTSLLWLDGRQWWPYVPVFSAMLAPAERLLGKWRYAITGLTAHVVATLVSQMLLSRSIRQAKERRKSRHARDVGVSYFAFGIGGALCRYLDRPWRIAAQIVGAGSVVVAVLSRANFTSTGHCVAFLVGALIPSAVDTPTSRRTPVARADRPGHACLPGTATAVAGVQRPSARG
ncbi:MAG: hypothetical protein QOD39_2012 [Mycobacterium sp.]|jgi:hypothetical protein|nr:hypothetical protein [Mycobacterium sp.]